MINLLVISVVLTLTQNWTRGNVFVCPGIWILDMGADMNSPEHLLNSFGSQ